MAAEMKEVALVAVVEVSKADESAHRSNKIRISDRTCTGRELYDAILGHVGEDGEFDTNMADVQIYDVRQRDFISLLQSDMQKANIIDVFGARVRCLVREKSDSEKSLPAIAGRFYPYDDENGIEVEGKRVLVKELPNLPGAGTGVNVWDGAILLARYLVLRPDVVKCRRVLELGSGCGIVGIVSGLLGAAEVILTDLPYVMPLMKENVNRHMTEIRAAGCKRIECMECDWFNPCSMANMGSAGIAPWQTDVLLLADCVWVYDLVAPLLNTMKKLAAEATSPITVIVSYQRRGKSAHEAFMSGLDSLFAEVVEIDVAGPSLMKPNALSLIECRQ